MIRHSQSAVPAVSIRALIRPRSMAPTGSSSAACRGEHNLARQPQHRISGAVKARHDPARLRIVGIGPPREVLDLAGPDVDVIADVPSVPPHLEAACVVLAPVRTGGGLRIRRELGDRARAFADRHHSPAAWAARLEAIYEEARDGQSEEARG